MHTRNSYQFQINSQPAHLDFLIATRDSENSQRPRLTIQPLSSALHLPIQANLKNKDFGALADQLREAKYTGKTILFSWHHGNIPNLLLALGADPARLLPNGKWPENVFGWLVQLRYDNAGQLKESVVRNEKLMPADSDLPPPAAR